MGFLGLKRAKPLQSKDPKEREAAVRAMPTADQGTLCEIALGDPDAQVRVAAAAKIRSTEYLEHLRRHKDPAVARIARDRLVGEIMRQVRQAAYPAGKELLDQVTEQSALTELALQADDPSMRKAACERLLALPDISQRALATLAIQEETGAYGDLVLQRVDTRQLLKDIVKKAKYAPLRQAADKRLQDLSAEARKPSPEKLRVQLIAGLRKLVERAQVLSVSERFDEVTSEFDRLRQERQKLLGEFDEVADDERVAEQLAALDRARDNFDRRRQEAADRAAEAAANAESKAALLAELEGLETVTEEGVVGARARWAALGSAGKDEDELVRRWQAWCARHGAEVEDADVDEPPVSAAMPPAAPEQIELTQDQLDQVEPLLVEAEGLLVASGSWKDRDYRFKEIDKGLLQQLGQLPPTHPLRKRFLDAYRAFKDARRQQREEQAQLREERLAAMRGLLTEAEALAAEQPDTATVDAHLQRLQDLQKRWRAVGTVPASALGDLRERFRASCDQAYEPVRARNEARDLERLAKVPEAEALIERAQGLVEAQPDPAERQRAVRDLQQEWKAVGRLPRERNDELWGAFKAACDAIYESLQDYFAERDREREETGQKKEALLTELAGLVAGGPVGIAGSIADREATVDRGARVKEIQAEWKALGPAPRAVNQSLWDRYKKLLDQHYAEKRAEFQAKDAERTENLHRKTALCIAAEELADDAESYMGGTRIGNKTEADFVRDMKELQQDWRNVGHVPREHFTAIRERFDGAKDRLYGALESYFAKQDESRQDNLAQKQAILAEIEDLLEEERPDWFKDQARELQARWREVGPVPRAEMAINDRFNEACDRIFNQAPPAEKAVVSFERGNDGAVTASELATDDEPTATDGSLGEAAEADGQAATGQATEPAREEAAEDGVADSQPAADQRTEPAEVASADSAPAAAGGDEQPEAGAVADQSASAEPAEDSAADDDQTSLAKAKLVQADEGAAAESDDQDR